MMKVMLDELVDDPSNANLGTERGNDMLRKSIERFGFLEAGVLDKNNVIVSGNKRKNEAAEAGMTEAVVIDHDGTTPIYIRYNNLDINESLAREAAYYLNRVGQVNLEWDASRILSDAEDGIDFTGMFTEKEFAGFKKATHFANGGDGDEDFADEVVPENFGIMIVCADEHEQAMLLERFQSEGLKVSALIS